MPRLVAMLPHTDEEIDESTGRNMITGIDLVTIPYSNEVRSLEAANIGGVGLEPVTPEEEAAATALIKAMQFDDGFRYQDLQNPARQHMYAVLQAVALNQVSPSPSLPLSLCSHRPVHRIARIGTPRPMTCSSQTPMDWRNISLSLRPSKRPQGLRGME
jgi:hypothetical protein